LKSVKFLLELQKRLGLNDSALAQKLGLTQAAISHYKNEKRVMDDETCLAVAMALGVDPLQVVGAACIDRAAKTGQHSLWEVFMSRTAQATSAMLALVFVTLFLTVPDAQAAPSPMTQTQRQDAHSLYYVKLRN